MTTNKKSYPKVAIIILNWNGWEDTIECLESLYQINYPNYEIIVIDNGSNDKSIEKIKSYANGEIKPESSFIDYNEENKPLEVSEYKRMEIENGRNKREGGNNYDLTLIKNEKNRGFTEGNNIGIRYALNKDSDYFLLLNNDTVVEKDFLSKLVEYGEKDKKIGILNPKIYYYDFKGRKDVINFVGEDFTLWRTGGYRYKSEEIDQGHLENPIEVNSLNGACFLIKRKIVSEIGFLDTDYFLRREETDYCYRAGNKGYKLVCVPNAKIWHKEFSSASQSSPLITYYSTRNNFLLVKKNGRDFDYLKFLVYFISYLLWVKLIFYLNNEPKVVPYFFKGILDGLKFS